MRRHLRPAAMLASCFLLPAGLAAAQTPPRDLIVSDPGGDVLWRLSDLDADGTFHGALEARVFFDDSAGTLFLGDPTGLSFAPDGRLFVSDTAEDRIFVFEDKNGDGDALDPGEHAIFFDGNPGGNASNVRMVSGNSLHVAADGKVWVASNNQLISGVVTGEDLIFWCEDLDGDGDANDPGEATIHYRPALGGAVGDSIPTDVFVGADGIVHYLENGVTASPKRGVYRLEDLDGSGSIDPQAGEVTTFFIAPQLAGNAFHWGFARDVHGFFFVLDHGNDVVWRIKDIDGDGAAATPGEFTQFFVAPSGSTMWQCDAAPDGNVYVVDDGATLDLLRQLRDIDQDGQVSGVEAATPYIDSSAAVDIGSPRCVAIVPSLLPAHPGNGTDAEIQMTINGAPSPFLDDVHYAVTGDTLALDFVSPGGSLNGRPIALLLQIFLTAAPPTPITVPGDPQPALWLNLSLPYFVVFEGFSSPAGPKLGGTGALPLAIPPGVNGLGVSAMFTLLVEHPFHNAANLGVADAHELRLP